MVFKFQDIKEQLSMILNTWLFMYEKLEPAMNLYFSTINNEELYIDNKFLSFIQGLETFHRRTTDNLSISEREHQDRISKILDSVPEQYRNWLNEKLIYSNEPSLRRRLKELLEPFNDLFGTSNERKQLIDKFVVTRNY